MKKIIMLCLIVGSIIGGYVPTIWGDSAFGGWSILTSSLGGILGIWIGYKLGQGIE